MEIRPQIQVKNRKTGVRNLYRMDDNRLLIGRDSSNIIVLEGKTVSRRHTEILEDGNQFFVRDLKSNNGTFLNERKLASEEKTLLRSGDIIKVEDFDLLFRVPAPGEVQDLYETTDTDILEIKMLKKLLRAMDKESAPSLEVLEGNHAGKRFALEGKNQDALLGRDPACEFVIDEEVISRKHARLEKRFDTVLLHDLGSKNGTYVNREKIRERRLKDGDILHLGTLPFLFRNPQELATDLSPPDIKRDEAETPAAPPHQVISEGARVARPPIRDLPPESPEESRVSQAVRAPRMSFAEILALIVGLAVLIGALWGILKFL